MVSGSTTQFCSYREKAAVDSTYMNEHGWFQ